MYWKKRNKSNIYPIKLKNEINNLVHWIMSTAFKGKPAFHNQVFVIFHREYAIFYKLDDLLIAILAIWDTRQNPEKKYFEF